MKHVAAQFKRAVALYLRDGESLLVCGPGQVPNVEIREMAARFGVYTLIEESRAGSFAEIVQALDNENLDTVALEAGSLPMRSLEAAVRYLKGISRRVIIGCPMPPVKGDVIQAVNAHFQEAMPYLDRVVYVDSGVTLTVKPMKPGVRQSVEITPDGDLNITQRFKDIPRGTEVVGLEVGDL
ncbi:hypothetical protein [Streptomyces sp. 5-10]|uniref:hypothetical protein n=1 Tax=Streptomyces sp. 5-10 TaxID=878925 RepID=UPI00168BC225|nr:hypothetical protein [Streptomyces sp. 5-10]MBD3004782.1 hypothetical protein [Streptomyces sp. 5-10]